MLNKNLILYMLEDILYSYIIVRENMGEIY